MALNTTSSDDILGELYRDHNTKQKRASRLKQEYEAARLETSNADSAFRARLTLNARKECLHLAEIMYRKLPFELRECVYRYVCIDERPILVGPYYHQRHYSKEDWPSNEMLNEMTVRNTVLNDVDTDRLEISNINLVDLPDGQVKEIHDSAPPSDMLMPTAHFFNQQYMGENIAREAQIFYFKHNTFSVCHVDAGIASFLAPKHFYLYMEKSPRNKVIANLMSCSRELNVEPLNHVRNLQIRIKCEHFDHDSDLYRSDAMVPAMSPSEIYGLERHFLHQVWLSLHLLDFPPDKDSQLNIEFIIMTCFAPKFRRDARFNEERRMLNLLEAIRSRVYDLKYGRAGAHIKVLHHDDGLFIFPRDLTAYWSLSREQWAHEVSQNERSRLFPLDFFIAPEHMNESQALMGFTSRELGSLRQERWGVRDVLNQNRPVTPLAEGKYWPFGKIKPGWDDLDIECLRQ